MEKTGSNLSCVIGICAAILIKLALAEVTTYELEEKVVIGVYQ